MKNNKTPRSLALAEAGIKTSAEMREFATAAIADVLSGRIDTRKANSAKGYGWLALRTSEIEYRLSARIEGKTPRRTIALDSEAST